MEGNIAKDGEEFTSAYHTDSCIWMLQVIWALEWFIEDCVVQMHSALHSQLAD